MDSIEIGEFARKYVYRVSSENTLKDVMEIMIENNIRHIPVIDDEDILGLVLINNVLKLLDSARSIKILETKVKYFYTPDIVILNSNIKLADALNTLSDIDLDVLLVMHDDCIRGIYTEIDILNTDFLWVNLTDEAVHSNKSIGEEITDFNCVSEDSTVHEAIQLFISLNRNYIGVIEPTTKRLKGEITSLSILQFIHIELEKNINSFIFFSTEPVFKLHLQQVVYFEEPSLLSILRNELYLNERYIAAMLDESGFPIRMLTIDHIIDYFYENRNILK